VQIRSGRTLSPTTLDALDTGIIDLLRLNGRATNQEVAEKLSVTAATVSSRLRRLEEMGASRVVAVTDFAAHGYNVLIAVGVKVAGRDLREVACDLARLPEVLSANIMNGAHEIEMLVALHDFNEINLFLLDHVANISGVDALSTGIAADIVKFEFNVVPL